MRSRRNSRRDSRITIAALALAGSCAALAGCRREDERLNVLLVTLDTTRADALSCYGAPPGSTPNLDELAAQGARFDCAISTAAVTPVSHASILTGLENMEHGVRVLSADSGFRLPERARTLATLLHSAGWATAAIHSAFPVSAHFGFQRGFDVFESLEGELSRKNERDGWDVATLQRRSDETTERVLSNLAARPEPWFLWIHYWDPHDDARVPPDEALPRELPRNADGRPLAGRELYAAEVHYMDAQFGRVIAELKRRGEWERTIVVVVADHGEGLGDHAWNFHRLLYQEQIRVPLIVRIPGVAAHTTHGELVRTTDIAPTVLDYTAQRERVPMSGRTLRPLLEGRSEAPRVAYADQINGFDRNAGMVRARPLDTFLYCAMTREWKLIYRPEHPDASELYHLSEDPRELSNVYTREHPMTHELGRVLAERNGWVLAPFPPSADTSRAGPNASSALATLGYAEGEIDETRAHGWAWTCPEHSDVVTPDRRACPRCQSAPLLVRPR